MKNVRVFYRKFGPCKYISHLDTNRVMIRAIGKSRLNIWRTEGFNQHAYITFALPLSLGFASECESMDFRVLDDDEDLSAIPDRLNACLPDGIRVLRCAESVHKPADIESAAYTVILEPMNEGDISDKELSEKLIAFLDSPEIIVEKKTKKGMKNIDLKPYILAFDLHEGDKVCFDLKLPAGSTLNINPNLLMNAFADHLGIELYADITRAAIYTKGGEAFV
jgi:radical SAM-linked protein